MVHRLEQIHYLIGKIRKGKHISQQVLGRGICSIQQISKIEKGDVSPDFFLTEILLQRLGMSPDKFEIVLSLEEYEEIETRDDIIDDLRQGRPEAAEKRLETFCEDAGRNQPIRQMNRFRL
ncbi:MAG: helix-turn-helix domain-containing protein, partial [Acetatifactor sp.]|nr:helix-turn-helix domain-containing protein [Acetatifactor sp.]